MGNRSCGLDTLRCRESHNFVPDFNARSCDSMFPLSEDDGAIVNGSNQRSCFALRVVALQLLSSNKIQMRKPGHPCFCLCGGWCMCAFLSFRVCLWTKENGNIKQSAHPPLVIVFTVLVVANNRMDLKQEVILYCSTIELEDSRKSLPLLA